MLGHQQRYTSSALMWRTASGSVDRFWKISRIFRRGAVALSPLTFRSADPDAFFCLPDL